MTELVFSEKDKTRAENLAAEIDSALSHAKESYAQLMWSFSKLGNVLLEVRTRHFWKLYGFRTFGDYIKSIESRAGKSHTALYSYIGVAERLSPYVSESDIEKIGIGKATELAKVPKLLGIAPSKEIMDRALDETVSLAELKEDIFKTYKMKSADSGKYFDLGPVVVDADQKAEILAAFDIAAKTDPIIDLTLPEIVRKTEIILRLCREYVGTYSAEVAGIYAEIK